MVILYLFFSVDCRKSLANEIDEAQSFRAFFIAHREKKTHHKIPNNAHLR